MGVIFSIIERMRKILLCAVCSAAGLLAGCNGTATPGSSNRSHGPSRPRIQVWIDTDASIGVKDVRDRDIDVAWAMIQAFHSLELQVAGVSAVFGNSPLNQTYATAGEITGLFGPSTPPLSVYKGASGPADLGRETDASIALARALQYQRLTILALGPMTNIATVLKLHPDLQGRIVGIVAVAGRHSGRRFTTGGTNPTARRDFNFELDPEALRVLLGASKVPLVLTPFEISSKIWIDEKDIQRLQSGKEAARYLYAPSRDLLALWQTVYNVQGFNPFATLAVGYLTSPSYFRCADLPAEIVLAPDDVLPETTPGVTVHQKPYFLVSPAFAGARTVRYCFDSAPAFKENLMRRILGGPDTYVPEEVPNPL